jgi:hypothetical protein
MKPEIISTRPELDEFYRLAGLRLDSHRRYARRSIIERLGLDPAAFFRRTLTNRPPLDPAAYVGLTVGKLAALDPATYDDQFQRARRHLETDVGPPVADARSRGQWVPVSDLHAQAVWSHFARAACQHHAMGAEVYPATASACSDPLRAVGYQAILEALMPQHAIRAEVFAAAILECGYLLRCVGCEYRLEALLPRRTIRRAAERTKATQQRRRAGP